MIPIGSQQCLVSQLYIHEVCAIEKKTNREKGKNNLQNKWHRFLSYWKVERKDCNEASIVDSGESLTLCTLAGTGIQCSLGASSCVP